MATSSLVSFPCISFPKAKFKPMAALSKSSRTYELKKGQNRLYHKLPSGLKMEVIEQRKEKNEKRRSEKEKENPPLVFVHGSYHAAWCWAEHWLPFFSSSGFDSYAISLLAQVQTPFSFTILTFRIFQVIFEFFRVKVMSLWELLLEHLRYLKLWLFITNVQDSLSLFYLFVE